MTSFWGLCYAFYALFNDKGVSLISFRDPGAFWTCQSLGGKASPRVQEVVKRTLEEPLLDFYSRPRKEFRGGLVNIGFSLLAKEASPDEVALARCREAIEALHTGSLIVDDIEDQSEWRRGAPSLHLRYGLPAALNAGNWLYFYAFERLRHLNLDAERKLLIFELTESILREAHCGQAIDLGADMAEIQNSEIVEICRASLELKSGALMGLALGLGAIVAGVAQRDLRTLIHRGIDLGVSLQMFDDLGNARVDQPTPKHLEDLKLRRPSFVWWHLVEAYPDEREAFLSAVQELPKPQALAQFFARVPLLKSGWQAARKFQTAALNRLNQDLSPDPVSFQQLQAIAERVANAYT